MLFENKITQNKNAFLAKVKAISSDLGINPNWLMGVMNFESAGTFRPDIQNPYSNATGLIQFMPSTAKGLGTSIESLKQMSNVEQLDYVKKYLLPFKTKMKSFVDVYLSVFYPLAVGKPDNYIVGSHNNTESIIVKQNKPFDYNKNGQITKKEIENMLFERMPEMKSFAGSSSQKSNKKRNIIIIVSIVIVVAVVFYYRKPICSFIKNIF